MKWNPGSLDHSFSTFHVCTILSWLCCHLQRCDLCKGPWPKKLMIVIKMDQRYITYSTAVHSVGVLRFHNQLCNITDARQLDLQSVHANSWSDRGGSFGKDFRRAAHLHQLLWQAILSVVEAFWANTWTRIPYSNTWSFEKVHCPKSNFSVVLEKTQTPLKKAQKCNFLRTIFANGKLTSDQQQWTHAKYVHGGRRFCTSVGAR